jgi:hypothetical protein
MHTERSDLCHTFAASNLDKLRQVIEGRLLIETTRDSPFTWTNSSALVLQAWPWFRRVHEIKFITWHSLFITTSFHRLLTKKRSIHFIQATYIV